VRGEWKVGVGVDGTCQGESILWCIAYESSGVTGAQATSESVYCTFPGMADLEASMEGRGSMIGIPVDVPSIPGDGRSPVESSSSSVSAADMGFVEGNSEKKSSGYTELIL
jgi:hypothetical protein